MWDLLESLSKKTSVFNTLSQITLGFKETCFMASINTGRKKIGVCSHQSITCAILDRAPVRVTRQWPLVNSNGPQSSSQALLTLLTKSQVVVTRRTSKGLFNTLSH